MKRFVILDLFEGPLDLLLHLVKEQELDIFSVDLYRLTMQYLEFLREVDFADLSDAGSFVQMASYLVKMKSSSLLPDHKEGAQVELGSEGEEDEEMRFRRRMHEYSLFQGAAHFFQQASSLASTGYSGSEWLRLEGLYGHESRSWSGDAAVLLVLYEQMLTSLPERKQGRVVAKSHKLAIQSLIERFQEFLKKVPAFRFEDCYPVVSSRYVLVAGVVALLQLAKERRVELSQEQVLESLWVRRRGADESQKTLEESEEVSYSTQELEQVFRFS